MIFYTISKKLERFTVLWLMRNVQYNIPKVY